MHVMYLCQKRLQLNYVQNDKCMQFCVVTNIHVNRIKLLALPKIGVEHMTVAKVGIVFQVTSVVLPGFSLLENME